MESTIIFKQPEPPTAPSLACQLGIGPKARWRTMQSGIQLTYEENDVDYVTVWVAEKRRQVIVETEPVLASKWVAHLGMVAG